MQVWLKISQGMKIVQTRLTQIYLYARVTPVCKSRVKAMPSKFKSSLLKKAIPNLLISKQILQMTMSRTSSKTKRMRKILLQNQ